MKAALQRFFRSELAPDMQDALVFGGLGLACWGVSYWSGPAALLLGGGACFWLGVRR